MFVMEFNGELFALILREVREVDPKGFGEERLVTIRDLLGDGFMSMMLFSITLLDKRLLLLLMVFKVGREAGVVGFITLRQTTLLAPFVLLGVATIPMTLPRELGEFEL